MPAHETLAADRAAFPPWPVTVALALLGVFALAYSAPLARLAARWSTLAPESHGWLVALAVPVLVWFERDRLVGDGVGRTAALPLLLASILGCALASAAYVDVVAWAFLPAIAWSAAWLALGRADARRLLLPIGYLWFAVPVWAVLTPGLQRATANVSSALLAVTGVAAYVDGDFVTVPAGTFAIEGGCSGINFLVVALALAAALTVIDRLPLRRALTVAALGVVLALVANWFRVAIIMWVGNASRMHSPLVADHYAFGWWVFAAGLVPYFLAARAIARGAPVAGPVSPAARRGSGPVVLPAVLLLLGGGWVSLLDRQVAADDPPLDAPRVVGWEGPLAVPAAGGWRPAFPGASRERFDAYRRGEATIEAYAASYRVQGPGRKLIGYGSTLAGTPGGADAVADWMTVAAASRPVAGAPGARSARVAHRTLATPDGRRRVVWAWYEIGTLRTESPVRVRVEESLRAFGRPARAAVIALSAECRPDCAAAESELAAGYAAGLWRFGTAGGQGSKGTLDDR